MIPVLTIAGSDSSGGAGVQADMKTFSVLGVHGCSVITCVTAQSSKTVKTIYPLPLNVVEEQIDIVVKDLKIKVVKTGMLHDAGIVKLVAKKIKDYKLKAVVDPVMTSTTGKKLIAEDYADSLRRYLIPTSMIVMPNLYEAGVIANFKVRNINDMKKACRIIHKMGAKYVLMKGGHLRKNCVDVLYDGKKFLFYCRKKMNKKAHGSGCTYSSLVAGFVAKGYSVENAVGTAKKIINRMIESGYNVGSIDVVNQNAVMNEKYRILKELKNTADWVEETFSKKSKKSFRVQGKLHFPCNEENLKPDFVPEVGINISYALPDAKNFDDVCGIDGRIVKIGGKVKRMGDVDFGKSKHVARIVLTAMKFDPGMRSAMNIRYSENVVKKAKRKKLSIGFFDRKHEPKNVSTMEWGSKTVIEKLGFVPDIIYDKGGFGKEAMIRIIGKSPEDVVGKLKALL
ncbi:MAG: bifunctional hydroxymethylpyrimidine kinase/phosphomethylpyrimidine kinase [Candidatus Thermoplasmatota archaeon]|nr:bifunctional hydroxymethylpyrimidine kinase/phosphomethylpyrimidine kinase [Candidatus Thermoplasmatota archaeon]